MMVYSWFCDWWGLMYCVARKWGFGTAKNGKDKGKQVRVVKWNRAEERTSLAMSMSGSGW